MKTYLNFEEILSPGKTKRYHVTSLSNGTGLGFIAWYNSWRKYCFFPTEETVFDSGCLKEITGFMDGLMEERKTNAINPNRREDTEES